MEIYLLRHGITVWNEQYKIQGESDIPLNETGRLMAVQTGEKLKEKGIVFDRVYSSPLIRAVETGKLVAKDAPLVTDERIKEMCFGRQEGHSIDELAEAGMPFELFKMETVKYDEVAAQTEDIETFTHLCKRAADFLTDVIESDALRTEEEKAVAGRGRELRILISGHGAVNQAMRMHIHGKTDIARFWEGGLLPNCGFDVISFDVHEKKYTLKEENVELCDEELKKKVPRILK